VTVNKLLLENIMFNSNKYGYPSVEEMFYRCFELFKFFKRGG